MSRKLSKLFKTNIQPKKTKGGFKSVSAVKYVQKNCIISSPLSNISVVSPSLFQFVWQYFMQGKYVVWLDNISTYYQNKARQKSGRNFM